MCSESANSAKSAAVSCIMSIYRVKCSSPNVEESEKLILDPHPDPDHHLNLTTSSGSSRVVHFCLGCETTAPCDISFKARRIEISLLTYLLTLPIAHVYRVWSTSVNAFVSCPAYRQTDRQTKRTTDRQRGSHSSTLVE